MPALDLAAEPIPLWWTTDFILASPVGTPAEEEKLGAKRSSKALSLRGSRWCAELTKS